MMAPKKSPLDSIAALLKRAPRGFTPAVGQTPHTVVWTENKWRLLRFTPTVRRHATPILMVPSLINRWYVLDLGPGRSLIEWLVAQGHTPRYYTGTAGYACRADRTVSLTWSVGAAQDVGVSASDGTVRIVSAAKGFVALRVGQK